MDSLVEIAATLVLLVVAGTAIGLFRRREFSFPWLLVAAGLVALNDLLLLRGYGLIPDLFHGSHWNWEGKVLALAATLAIAALPAFGWRASGITLAQARGSLKVCLPVVLVYCAVFLALAVMDHSAPSPADDLAFQLTMPGLEEEPFYRGLLLLVLDRAFAGRVRFLGVDWGWGAVLSCALFGLAHALDFSHGRFSLDPMLMALTAGPSFIAVWLRLRSGSLLWPVLMHNFGNSISMLV